MPQLGIVRLHRVRLAFVQDGRKLAGIHELGVGGKAIGKVVTGGRGLIHQGLQAVPVALVDHAERLDAAGVSVYAGQNVSSFFFCPTQV